jgi:hypothetical protein
MKTSFFLAGILGVALVFGFMGCGNLGEPTETPPVDNSTGGIMSDSTADKIFDWKEENSGVTIVKFKNAQALSAYVNGGKFVINQINGKPVTKIAENAFNPKEGAANLADAGVTRITLPDSILEIAETAFANSGLAEGLDIPIAALNVLPPAALEVIASTVTVNPDDAQNVLEAQSDSVDGFTFRLIKENIPVETRHIDFLVYGEDYEQWAYGIYDLPDSDSAPEVLRPYPFVEPGKTYTFYITFYDGEKFIKRGAPVTKKAEYGIGEAKVSNYKDVQVVFDPADCTARLVGTPRLPTFKDYKNINRVYIRFTLVSGENWGDSNARWESGRDFDLFSGVDINQRVSFKEGNSKYIGRYPMFCQSNFYVKYKGSDYEATIATNTAPFQFPDFPVVTINGTIGDVTVDGEPLPTQQIILQYRYGSGDNPWHANGLAKQFGSIEITTNSSWIIKSETLSDNETLHLVLGVKDETGDVVAWPYSIGYGYDLSVSAGEGEYTVDLGNVNINLSGPWGNCFSSF